MQSNNLLRLTVGIRRASPKSWRKLVTNSNLGDRGHEDEPQIFNLVGFSLTTKQFRAATYERSVSRVTPQIENK
jgi:hypothetical protein